MTVAITLSPQDYDVLLFDLDGVLTRTASVHAAAWKKLFDGFLEQRVMPEITRSLLMYRVFRLNDTAANGDATERPRPHWHKQGMNP